MASFIRATSLFCAVSFLMSASHALNIPRAGEAISGGSPTATSIPSATSFLNISSTSTSTTSSQEGPTTCSVDLSLITPDPVWGPQVITENLCSFTSDTVFSGESTSTCIISWSSCRLTAASVHLYYWTDLPGNQTYPKSIWNTQYNITMTSPSVYVAYVTMSASNDCGRIGPVLTTTVLPYDLDQISTLLPYAGTSAFTLVGTQKRHNAPLTLSDLNNCEGQATKTYDPHFPLPGDNYRCNPQIYFPQDLKKVGYPYWYGCGRKDGGSFGLDDPPHAIEPCTTDDCIIPDDPDTPVENPDPTTTAISLPPTTSISVPLITSNPVPPKTLGPVPPTTSNPESLSISILVPPVPSGKLEVTTTPTESQTPVETPTIPDPTAPVVPTPVESSSLIASNSYNTISTSVAPGSSLSPAPVPPVAIVTISPAPSGSGDTPTSLTAFVASDQTATVGGPVVKLGGNIVASAAQSGLVVQLPGGGVSTIPSVAKPTAAGGTGMVATTSETAQFTAGASVVDVGVGGFIVGIAVLLML